ncbi:unnamed protein product, partial [Thlaspi arvense]
MDLLLPTLNSPAIAGLVFALLLALYYLLWRSIKPKSKSPPEAGGAMADKFGPIFTFRIGLHQSVVVSSWDIAKKCFTHPRLGRFAAAKHLGDDYAMFGFSPCGPYWRDLRKLVMIELLAPRQLELLRIVRLSETENAVKELYKLWVERKDASGRVLVEMKQWFADLTLNVVVRIIAGKSHYIEEFRFPLKPIHSTLLNPRLVYKRYFGSGADPSDEKEAQQCQRAFRKIFHHFGVIPVSDAIPFLGGLDFGGVEKAMKETTKEIDSIMEGWLEDHGGKRDSSEVDGDHDFMTHCPCCYDADTVNKATCLVNHDCKFHKIKIQAPREFTEDCHVYSYYISKDTRLTLNLWNLQRDPAVWPSPKEFQPERFLTTHKNIDVKGQSFELIPFGASRRVCLGVNFGMQMLHLVLARLLHGFEFSTPTNALVDMTESAGLTNMKTTPLEVVVAPRLAATLY